MLEQFLENIFSNHTPKSRVGDLFDKFSNLLRIVAELVDKFVGVNGAVINYSFNLHGHIVLRDDLLGRHPENLSFHVDLDDAFADGVDEVEAGFENSEVAAKGLLDAQLGS
jgi:hypothetical protein